MVEHLEKSGQFLSEEQHEMRLDSDYKYSYMIVYQRDVIGTLKYRKDAKKVEVQQIQIHPNFQNKGFGRGVMQYVINNADPKIVELTVLKDNPALKLYKRLGFIIIGEDQYEYHMQIKH